MVALAGLHWPAVFDALVLERDAVLRGQLWRLWSGHLVHLDLRHATFNLAALALLAAIAARMRQLPALLRTSLLLMPLLSIGLLLAAPALQWYAGLSGLLHGWAAWLLLRHGGRIALAAGIVLAAKLAWEQIAPATGSMAFPVIHAAHLIGALLGAGFALIDRKTRHAARGG